jgi:hypothetical protein
VCVADYNGDYDDRQHRRTRGEVELPAFRCDQCDKCYNHRTGLVRHKKTCTGSVAARGKSDDDLREKYSELEKRVEELSRQKPQQHQNTFTINNTTVNVNAFGKEDTSGISQQVLDQCLRRTNLGLVDLVKRIHFDNVSNRNVKASIDHSHIVECHNGLEWRYDQKKKVLQQIVDSGHRMMSEHFDDNTDRLKSEMSNALFHYVCDWLCKMEKNNHAIYADMIEKVFVMILNHSKSIG